jgi:hypothetical protein
MQTYKPHTFLSDWGFHLVILAVALPIVGLAYLAWTALPAPNVARPAASQTELTHWRSVDVAAAFQDAGLPAQIVRGESKEERDGLSGFMAVDSLRFRISEGEEEMGMVMCFENAGDLQRMRNYYLGLNRSLPQFKSWLFVKDNILLQINYEVPEHTARAYAAILDTLDD